MCRVEVNDSSPAGQTSPGRLSQDRCAEEAPRPVSLSFSPHRRDVLWGPCLSSSQPPRGDPSRTTIPPFQRVIGCFGEGPPACYFSNATPLARTSTFMARSPAFGAQTGVGLDIPMLTRNPHQLPPRKPPPDPVHLQCSFLNLRPSWTTDQLPTSAVCIRQTQPQARVLSLVIDGSGRDVCSE